MSELLKQAVASHQSGNLTEASHFYEQVIEAEPDNADAYNLFATMLGQGEDVSRAEEYFLKAILLKPNTASFHYNFAMFLEMHNRIEEAKQHYQHAFDADSNYIKAAYALIRVHKMLGQKKEALSLIETLRENDSDNFELHKDYIYLLRECGEVDAALQQAEILLTLFADNADAHYVVGFTHEKLGDFVGAEKHYRSASNLAPNNAQFMSCLAVALKNQNKNDEARDWYHKSLALDPDQPSAKHALAALEGENPEHAPEEFVAGLFNSYAEKFDQHMDHLECAVPKDLYDAVISLIGDMDHQLRFLDIGCGTGRCGEWFRKVAKYVVGVDLAARMIEQSSKRGVYDQLYLGEVVDVIEHESEPFDLVVAGEVFIYVGALEEIFTHTTALVTSGSLFAFSIEESESKEFILMPTGRYAHSQDYIKKLAKQYDYSIAYNKETMLRKQENDLAHGRIMVLKKV